MKFAIRRADTPNSNIPQAVCARYEILLRKVEDYLGILRLPRRRLQASSSNDADIPRDPSLRSRMTARDMGEVKDLGMDRSRMTTRKTPLRRIRARLISIFPRDPNCADACCCFAVRLRFAALRMTRGAVFVRTRQSSASFLPFPFG